jgi:hypothetical protein
MQIFQFDAMSDPKILHEKYFKSAIFSFQSFKYKTSWQPCKQTLILELYGRKRQGLTLPPKAL